jgi:alanine-glyoxylate transaminase/serine-glyoxylate transaminase/serine-pyruvate transaminase
MTLANGRRHLAIPGPTNMPDAVLNAMHHPSVDIYGGPLEDASIANIADLKKIFRTTGDIYMYAANGHGAWEAALTNVLSKGNKILVLESGMFPTWWGDNAEKLELDVERLPKRHGRAVELAALEKRLAADTRHEITAIMMVQADTASGVVNDVAGVRKVMDACGHPALFLVDTIASLGCMEFRMDDWGIDVAVAGAQKGLMTPPGFSFTAASSKAKQAHKSADLVTGYWDWTFRDGKMHYMWYGGTPPVQMVFALRKALDMIAEEGLEHIFHRHAMLAGATRAAIDVWSARGAMKYVVSEPSERSNSITAVFMDGNDSERLIDYCDNILGVTLGRGIGEFENQCIRIAHMGHLNGWGHLGTLASIETGLAALGIDHKPGGVQAAVDFLARHTTGQ